MSSRNTRRRRLKKYSIGDIRERITIHTRTISAPMFDSVDFTETYDIGVKHWASIETIDKKYSTFSGVNIPENATHSFIIRFDSEVTTENIIAFDGDYYQIISIGDPDKRKQYMELFSKLKGEDTIEAAT